MTETQDPTDCMSDRPTVDAAHLAVVAERVRYGEEAGCSVDDRDYYTLAHGYLAEHPAGKKADNSALSQAAAWEAVWQELKRLGIYSYLPPDSFTHPKGMTGLHRAVSFIKHLAASSPGRPKAVTEAGAEAADPFAPRQTVPYDGGPAVWTDAECFAMNAAQHDDRLHGYTCGTDSRHRPLIATPSGWRCADCGYRQQWKH